MLVVAGIVAMPAVAAQKGPEWWRARGVLSANATLDDFAAVNQGQLKHIATQAAAEMNLRLDGGAGGEIMEMVAVWQIRTSKTDNYAAVNLGQLKAVAKPFYTRLIAIGYTDVYPWQNSLKASDNYALANIGQVKKLFSFDLAAYAAADSSDNVFLNLEGLPHFGQAGTVPKMGLNGDEYPKMQTQQTSQGPLWTIRDGLLEEETLTIFYP